MLFPSKIFRSLLFCDFNRPGVLAVYNRFSSNTGTNEFKVLNLNTTTKSQTPTRRKVNKNLVFSPRTSDMKFDQDWGSVWPGPRSFHPATVPLSLHQGYSKKGVPPGKYANAELMKIPNFLHLTPPVIKRQCEVLKQFCTSWPEELQNDELCEEHFPLEISSTSFCHSSPSLRNPLARVVTLRIKLKNLPLSEHSKDKLRRLVEERYDETTDIITITTDRCPTVSQNYSYAMYLLTAVFHESWNVELWEQLKVEADMEYYDWQKNKSKKSIELLFNKPYTEILHAKNYWSSVETLMNEGESEYSVTKYGEAVKEMLQLPV